MAADEETYESHEDSHQVESEASAGADDVPAEDAEEESDAVDAESGSAHTPAQELQKEPEDSEIEQIEHDRQERLAEDNRPDNAEVDNTDREFDSEKGMFTDAEGYDDAPNRFPPAAEQGV